MVQPEPSTEQTLMRKEKINIPRVSRKCVGSCTLEWGQEQEQVGALAEAQQGPVTQGGQVSLQPWLRVAPSDRSESRRARDDQRGDSRACPFWNEWHRRDPCAVPEPLHWDGSGSTHPSPKRAAANFTLGLHLHQPCHGIPLLFEQKP